jgi:hypothetical protein
MIYVIICAIILPFAGQAAAASQAKQKQPRRNGERAAFLLAAGFWRRGQRLAAKRVSFSAFWKARLPAAETLRGQAGRALSRERRGGGRRGFLPAAKRRAGEAGHCRESRRAAGRALFRKARSFIVIAGNPRLYSLRQFGALNDASNCGRNFQSLTSINYAS